MTDTSTGSESSSPTFVGRALRGRVPLWSLGVVVLLAVVAVIASWVLRDVADLGPAATHAKHVDATVVMCNRAVDANNINPRAAELQLQRAFLHAGARDADVRVTREDCPEERR